MLLYIADGTEIEVTVSGRYDDDIQLIDAQFPGNPERDPTDAELDWVLNHHAERIYEKWVEMRMEMAQDYCDLRNGR